MQNARTITLGYISYTPLNFVSCVLSITFKPLKISSWNFIEILTNIGWPAECTNHNNFWIYSFELFPFELCKYQFLWQNRVRSITLKPFKITSWNFIHVQMLRTFRWCAECKNHNSCLSTFNYAPLKFVSNSFCYKIASALSLENHSRQFDETSYKYHKTTCRAQEQ